MGGSCQLLAEACWFNQRNSQLNMLWKLIAIFNGKRLNNGLKRPRPTAHLVELYSVRDRSGIRYDGLSSRRCGNFNTITPLGGRVQCSSHISSLALVDQLGGEGIELTQRDWVTSAAVDRCLTFRKKTHINTM